MPDSCSSTLPPDSTLEVFGALVREASSELGQRPSPLAARYLVELLDARVRAAPVPLPASEEPIQGTLAGSLIEALAAGGPERLARLRALGDRALFHAGFFGPSLQRRVVGVAYYSEIGSTAYHRVSLGTGSEVFDELARGFPDFVELLGEVGDRARGGRSLDLLRLYDRYRATGSERVRTRLVRHGLIVRQREDRLQ